MTTVKFGVKFPSAFAGGSILALPADPAVLARGFYVTYDPRSFKPAKRSPEGFGQEQTLAAKNKGPKEQDTVSSARN